MLDFEALRIFTVVVKQGGFNAAANLLFKSQPAITATIKKLEIQLGFSLFDRSYYRPILTTEGEKFYQRAKVLVQHWENMNDFALHLEKGIETDVTIAIDVFFPFQTMAGLFSRWIQQFSQTRFHFPLESLGGPCERLINRQADIIISENLISGHAIEVIVLHTERMIPVATPTFISQYRDELADLDSLHRCMQVILRDSSKSDFTFGVMNNCRHWTVSDVIAKKEVILAGLGWGRLPGFLIHQELVEEKLEILKGNHFDERLITLSAMRLQKPSYGPILAHLWADLLAFKTQTTSIAKALQRVD